MTRKFTFLLMALLALAGFKSWGQETIEIGDGNNISYHFPFSSYYNFTTPDSWDGHTINYTLNDSYGDGWNGAYLTIVDSDDNTIETLALSIGRTESGSLTLCSGTYDFVWHKGSYDDECSFSISENEETLFTCYDAFAYTDGEVVYTLGLLEKFAITLTQPEDAAVGTISADYEQAATANPSSDILGGTTVTLTISPATGYVLAELHVLDEGENEQAVTINPENSNIRTFIMPESNVTVSAVFSPVYNISIDMALVGGSISQMSAQGTLTAYPAGTRVFLFANPDEDYSFVENSFIVIRSDGEIGPTVTYTDMRYSFIMPESNVTVSATFNKTAFAVSQVVTPMHSGSFAIDKTAHVGIGETVTLSYFNAYEGYYFDFEDVNSVVVKRNDNQETVEVKNYGNIYEFAMPTSDVTVTATFKGLPRYSVFVGDVVNGTITLDNPYQDIFAGAIVYFEVYSETGYTLESITVTPEEGNPFEPTQGDWYYYFTMPSSNVTISATFCELQSYTINYYVNGELDRTMQCYEDSFVNNDGPQNVAVPAGMTFEGWGVAEIDPYTSEKPAVLGNAEKPTQDYNLYAVFSYTESVQSGETWKKVTSTSELSAGDEIVLVYGNYVMGGLWGTEDYHRSEVSIANNEISNLPSDANVLTLVASGSNWKLQYFESKISNTTTLSYTYSTWDCLSYYGYGNFSYDEWTAIESSGVMFYNNNKYIGNHPNGYFITVVNSTNTACKAYKKDNPFITNTYYMTSVLTEGEVANATFKNIIVVNPITVSGRLEMNENGLFRNEDAADFVFADGAQFYYTGTENVKATFEKEITRYTGERDNYYLIANPTDEENVGGLGWDGIDLYTFDPATDGEGNEWINEVYVNNNTNIERGTGYLYANQTGTTLSFAGELVPANSTEYSGMSLVLAETGEGLDFPGFNLLGNPYACNVYLDKPAYLLDGGEYQSIAANTAIAPCKGFFVEATAANQSVTISTTAPEAQTSALSLTVSQNRGNVIDRAIVNFNDNNDLHKFMMNPAHTNLSIAKGGETFAAISTEAEGELPVNFKAEKNGTYTISVNTENVEANYLHLIDNLTGMDTDLLSTPSYTFNATTSDYASRFKLVFSMNNNEDMSQANSFAYINNGEIIISNEGRATLQVIDVMGRIVSNQQIEGDARISTEGLTAGVYVLNLNGNVQKIVVR